MIVEKFFCDSLIRLGKFRCPVEHPSFENTGPARGYLIVFPREPVEITQAGKSPVVANSNVLMFYNNNQEYRRRAISGWGDRCEFFEVDHRLLIDSVSRFKPSVEEHFESPFEFASRRVSDRLYLEQRRLVDLVQQMDASVDPLEWNERSIQLIDHVIEEAFGDSHQRSRSPIKASHVDLVFDAQAYISRHYRSNLSLDAIANAIDSSAFHLCRVFSRVSGVSIHQYVTRLRMREALELVREGDDLTRIAMDLGYSSHSHFTSVFRRSFCMTPKQWRKT